MSTLAFSGRWGINAGLAIRCDESDVGILLDFPAFAFCGEDCDLVGFACSLYVFLGLVQYVGAFFACGVDRQLFDWGVQGEVLFGFFSSDLRYDGDC